MLIVSRPQYTFLLDRDMENKDYCCYCKETLTENNSIGGSFICKDCQKLVYKEFEGKNGCHMAIFLTCASANLPCIPSLAEKIEEESDVWEAYTENLKQAKKLEKGNRFTTFHDGISDIRQIFGREMTQTDFAKYIEYEKNYIGSLAGTAEQRERWGVGELAHGLVFSDSLYNELDQQYEVWIGRYKGQTITPPLEQSIITICKRNKVAEYLIEIGYYADAAKVQKMVDDLMASEQMRKKDEKPIETFRLDAWIDAFEKSGLMKNGDFLTIPEMEDSLIRLMRGKGYTQDLDCTHQLEKNILNNMRRNDDKQTIFDLPESMRITDELGEFAKEETDDIKHRKKYANMTKVNFRSADNADR